MFLVPLPSYGRSTGPTCMLMHAKRLIHQRAADSAKVIVIGHPEKER
ncbi:hypothetical protein RC1_1734 [Rhodospirillum centenum SW]|uniref:Uncharacterized protein n=1 Tax=Rhodospirillum centenum (strain ATCC 51521 / SW) TaxID=414684 RepID=B6ITB3_RHOCS|nr:hypothetical protein RC1_1734 [Rhodospirillum centenum SW]